ALHRRHDRLFRRRRGLRGRVRSAGVGHDSGSRHRTVRHGRPPRVFDVCAAATGEILMTVNGWFQILLFLGVVLALTAPLGRFMTRVFNRERTWLDPALRPIERLVYRLTGVDEAREMRWTEYAVAMLLFSAVSMLLLYLMQRVQQRL